MSVFTISKLTDVEAVFFPQGFEGQFICLPFLIMFSIGQEKQLVMVLIPSLQILA